jgi:hypothetical protein
MLEVSGSAITGPRNMNSSLLLTPTTNASSATPERFRSPHPSQSRNPVAARLYKVLNTNFNDEETDLAFQTLSELYSTASPGKELQCARNLVEDVEEHVPGQDNFTSSASPISLVEAVSGETAAKARKYMKKDMGKRLEEGSMQFLTALGKVDSVSAINFRRTRMMSVLETTGITRSSSNYAGEL